MPAKQVEIPGVGPIKVYKRKGARSIRLSIVGDGTVRVTQPKWLPYKAGIEFAHSRKKWISEHLKPTNLLLHKQMIGKSYQLEFTTDETAKTVRSRIQGNKVVVRLPGSISDSSPESQKVAKTAVERALKRDTENLLVPRAHELAEKHGFKFKSIGVKKLKSRWGSCTHNKDILLSSYLIQLPWHLIDYVILHELQHTTILAHGKPFWQALEAHVPYVAKARTVHKYYFVNKRQVTLWRKVIA